MLKKLLLLLPLAALRSGSAQAQLRYTFKDTTSAYVSLPASATSVNRTDIWEEENYVIPMPFTWSLDSAIQLNSIDLALEFPGFLNTNVASGNALTGFIPAFTNLTDRGAIDGTARLAALSNIKVYPRPASTSLMVEGASAGTKATLYSMLGQPVLQTVLAGNQTLDIALLPAGVYKTGADR